MKKSVAIILGAVGVLASEVGFAQQASINRSGTYMLVTNEDSVSVRALESGWTQDIKGPKAASFSIDGGNVLYKNGEDLCIYSLAKKSSACIQNVTTYKQPVAGKTGWLVYQPKTPGNEVVLRNLATGKESRFSGVTDYSFEENGKALLLKTTGQPGAASTALQWVDLAQGKAKTIWSAERLAEDGGKVGSYAFDANGTQVIFMVSQKRGEKLANAVMYYKAGMNVAEVLLDDSSAGIEEGLKIGNAAPAFSKRGSKVFFSMVEKSLPKPDPKMTKVDVWSYKDARLQSQQLKDLAPRRFAAVVNIADRRIVRLEKLNELVLGSAAFSSNERQQNDDYVLICQFAGDVVDYDSTRVDDKLNPEDREPGEVVEPYTLNEYNWNKATWTSVYLVSTKDGSRKQLKESGPTLSSNFPYYRFSPSGRYVVYFNEAEKKYYSYEIASGTTRSITENVPVSFLSENDQGTIRDYNRPVGIIGWIGDDAAALIGDRYSDIWRADLSGRKAPKNITNGYARNHHLRFYIDSFSRGGSRNSTFKNDNERIYLQATNLDTQDKGFFSTTLNASNDPELLQLGAYRYNVSKAADKDAFIVNRSSATESGRNFFSTDLKTLTPLTGGKVEEVKGSPGEVIRWKGFDGADLLGVLYKPENFDPGKKYPVIIEYYEKDGTGRVNSVERFGGKHPISRGYVYFVPDIHYVFGQTGPSAYNAVVSGAQEIAKLPFVDATKMGIHGHSFGGYQTNYIVTHSTMFAAACSGSGISNLITLYGSYELDKQGFSQMATNETGQFRIGANPWERLDLYIKSSPIFTTDQVTTPILLMANNNDLRVPVHQGVEFFKALRRLGKKAWMMQYDAGDHGAPDGDWSKRMDQFFDHYLKGEPPPKWMTEGIPARMKGVTDGLELDTSGKIP